MCVCVFVCVCKCMCDHVCVYVCFVILCVCACACVSVCIQTLFLGFGIWLPQHFFSTFNVCVSVDMHLCARVEEYECSGRVLKFQIKSFDPLPQGSSTQPTFKIFRRRPTTFFECHLEGPCEYTIYAARFDDNVAITPARHPDQLGNLSIATTVVVDIGQLGDQTTLDNGMVYRNFTFGALPNGRFNLKDIGTHYVACFTVKGHTRCKTPPLCITIKVVAQRDAHDTTGEGVKCDAVDSDVFTGKY